MYIILEYYGIIDISYFEGNITNIVVEITV